MHNFTGGVAGAFPFGGLVADSMGNLYGTAEEGGLRNCGGGGGCGVVFKIDATGAFTVLHTFAGGSNDGQYPAGALVLDASGNLYGTTTAGGSANAGTVFKLDPAENISILHSFSGTTETSPESGVISDGKGNFFGVAFGGSSDTGLVFRVTETGAFREVYRFTGGADGGTPIGRLVFDQATRNLYGTTARGGVTTGICANPTNLGARCGAIFKVDPLSGAETVLYAFTGMGDGLTPESGLTAVALSNGGYNLFGTTEYGGTAGAGVIFELTIQP